VLFIPLPELDVYYTFIRHYLILDDKHPSNDQERHRMEIKILLPKVPSESYTEMPGVYTHTHTQNQRENSGNR
jgi:hypothetical protein